MSIFQKVLKTIKYLLLGIGVLLVVLILVKISPALWNKWFTYPRLEAARAALWERYQEPPQIIQLASYNGVVHSHSFWSHDSRGLLPEILDGAKQADLKFIFLSDHKRHLLDSFPRGYQGVYDGIIIESGTEQSSGLMISPFDTMVVDWNRQDSSVIHDIVRDGGLAIYVHSEDEHDWENPDFQGMEIYNIHTDFLDEESILPLFINNIFNQEYRHWEFREVFDEQDEILARWDQLNEQRRIVGVAGADAHNNQNFRARVHDDGKVEWVGPNADSLVIREPNWFDKLLLGEPDEYGWSFKWEMDPYFTSFNFTNDYVFCDSFTNVNIKDHIKLGHVFISFEHLAKASGFQYLATNNADSLTAILGDSVTVSQVNKLRAISPFPVKFQLYKSGKLIDESVESYQYEYSINKLKGNYRIVARINLDDNWIPWIYTNPIYVY